MVEVFFFFFFSSGTAAPKTLMFKYAGDILQGEIGYENSLHTHNLLVLTAGN